MSRSYRLALFCSALCSIILAAPAAALDAFERVVAFVWAWITEPVDFDAAPFIDDRHVAFAGDCPVDAATSHALRHETGMRRLT
jgi:hypothetical protein